MGATIDLSQLVQQQINKFSSIEESTSTTPSSSTPEIDASSITESLKDVMYSVHKAKSPEQMTKIANGSTNDAISSINKAKSPDEMKEIIKNAPSSHPLKDKAGEYINKAKEVGSDVGSHLSAHWKPYAATAGALGAGVGLYKYLKSRKNK